MLIASWLAASPQTGAEPAATQPTRLQSPRTPSAVAPRLPRDGQAVREVEIVGTRLVTQSYAKSLLRTKAGEAYSNEQIQEDVRRMLRSGKFLTVTASSRVEADDVIVTFTVNEKPEVVSIEVEGNRKFKTKDLLKEVDLGVGDPLDLFAVDQGRDNIVRKYREAGYGDVEVEADQDLLKSESRVLYRVVEGPRIRVRHIQFEGNETFTNVTLSGKVGTKTYIWIFRTGAYDPDQVRQDEAALEKFYRDKGFLDVRVSSRLDFSADRKDLTVTFTILEGTRYRIREIAVRGNQVFTVEEIRNEMKLAPDAYWDQELLDLDIKNIITRYGNDGYVYAEVVPERVFVADQAGYVNLNISIVENQQVSVGRIVIRGNARTKDKVARREIEFFPEELYNITKVRDSERNLRESQLFSEATISPVGEEPGVRDALVDLVENDQTSRFMVGFGVGSNSGLVGQFVIENRNFDLFDWPRSFTELFKGRAFRGAGQTLRLQVEPGTEFNRLTIDFREPYLMDQPISLGTRFFLFERDRDAYDERRVGGNVSFGKRFKEGFLEGWAAEIAFRMEYVDISEVDFYDAEEIRDADGGHYLSSVKGTLVHNRTDSRFLPSRGDKFSVSYEQYGALGGEYFFGKAATAYDWYTTLHTDAFERKSILGLHGEVGYIIGDAPVFERYYAGGIGSIRGFEFRGISPRNGIKDDAVGGDTLVLTSAEYTFPLYAKVLRGVLFTDMGSVAEGAGIDTWRMAVGFGIRLTIDFFGPVPMEFDFAFPVSKDSEDDTQIFSFFFGTTF